MWARRTKTIKPDALHNFFVILTSRFSKHVVCYHLCETNGSTAAIKIQTITVSLYTGTVYNATFEELENVTLRGRGVTLWP
jgi:hypothetical protein